MNENTTKLIEQIASKLGTTTEYLWGVLIKQAYISAWTSLIGVIVWGIACFTVYKFHRYYMSKNKPNARYNYYDENESVGVVMMGCFFVLLLGFIFVFGFAISNILNGFLNPEFWALNHILEGIKK